MQTRHADDGSASFPPVRRSDARDAFHPLISQRNSVSHDFRSFKRVVVYRIGSLGDTLVVLPAFHLVRRTFPNAHITLLTNIPVHAKAAPMEAVLGSGGTFFDDVMRYPVSMRDFDGLRKLRGQLSEGRYDCLVYLASPKGGLTTSLRDWLFFRLCGIKHVLGVPFNRSTLESMPVPGTGIYQSRTTRMMEALTVLGSIDLKDRASWDLCLTSVEIAEADALLAGDGVCGPFLAASPGTKMAAKDWEEHHWAALIRRLGSEFPGLPLVLLGAMEERDRCKELAKLWQAPVANLCGLSSPRVSAAALRNAVAMVCHDSGPMHLAATMDVPCVSIFSARAKPGEWFPYGEQHISIYHQTPCWDCGLEVCIAERKQCILSISVEEVFGAVVGQLSRRGFAAKSQDARIAGAGALARGAAGWVRPWPAAAPLRESRQAGMAAASVRSRMKLGDFAPDPQLVPMSRPDATERVGSMLSRAGYGIPPGVRYILHAGREGVGEAVRLFSELRRCSDQGGLWLLLLGGPSRVELREIADVCGVTDAVAALETANLEETRALFSGAELLLAAGSLRGRERSILEAQACGCPVVICDSGGSGGIGGEAAESVEAEDVRASLDAILNVIYEDTQRRQTRVRRGIENATRYIRAIENHG